MCANDLRDRSLVLLSGSGGRLRRRLALYSGPVSNKVQSLKSVGDNIVRHLFKLTAPSHKSRVNQIRPKLSLIFFATCGAGSGLLGAQWTFEQNSLRRMTRKHAKEILNIASGLASNKQMNVVSTNGVLVNGYAKQFCRLFKHRTDQIPMRHQRPATRCQM